MILSKAEYIHPEWKQYGYTKLQLFSVIRLPQNENKYISLFKKKSFSNVLMYMPNAFCQLQRVNYHNYNVSLVPILIKGSFLKNVLWKVREFFFCFFFLKTLSKYNEWSRVQPTKQTNILRDTETQKMTNI